jgi:hypothetical protein
MTLRLHLRLTCYCHFIKIDFQSIYLEAPYGTESAL